MQHNKYNINSLSVEFQVLNIAAGIRDILTHSLRQDFAPILHDEDHMLKLGIRVIIRNHSHPICPKFKSRAALVDAHDWLYCENIPRLHYVYLA